MRNKGAGLFGSLCIINELKWFAFNQESQNWLDMKYKYRQIYLFTQVQVGKSFLSKAQRPHTIKF